MANARVARGRKSQAIIAEWFRLSGWRGAESMPASLPGKDITGMPGWSIEAKATAEARLSDALRQAARNSSAGDIPMVVYRPRGLGEKQIGEWMVAMRLADATALMQEWEKFDGGLDPD